MIVKVFYTWSQAQSTVYDPGFGQKRKWDLPLLDGYEYEFVPNQASNPGSHHFFGIINLGLKQSLKAFSPDAILVFGWSFFSHLRLILSYPKQASIWFRGDSNLIDELHGVSLKKILRRGWLRWVYSHVDAAFYVGLANYNYFKIHGLKDSQLKFAPHAIDNSRFQENQHELDEQAYHWREKIGVPKNSMVFLFVGKFEEKKNVLGLISAFKNSSINAFLFLVGDGPQKKEILDSIKDNQRIVMLGFQNQKIMPVVYRMSDVLVLPSKGPGETWGLVVNEAMACGKAILISNRCGCASDLVRSGENGYVFDPFNITDLEEKLLQMVDKIKVKNMGEQSKNIIKDYSFESIANAIERSLGVSTYTSL